jgi:hypothetical protein
MPAQASTALWASENSRVAAGCPANNRRGHTILLANRVPSTRGRSITLIVAASLTLTRLDAGPSTQSDTDLGHF